MDKRGEGPRRSPSISTPTFPHTHSHTHHHHHFTLSHMCFRRYHTSMCSRQQQLHDRLRSQLQPSRVACVRGVGGTGMVSWACMCTLHGGRGWRRGYARLGSLRLACFSHCIRIQNSNRSVMMEGLYTWFECAHAQGDLGLLLATRLSPGRSPNNALPFSSACLTARMPLHLLVCCMLHW